MKLAKIALAGTTALGLSMTMAVANGNEAFLKQDGTANSALVKQSGNDNVAGAEGSVMTQTGFTNQLTIDQSGSFNKIGLSANANGGASGIVQNSTRSTDVAGANQMTLVQSSWFNEIGAISQRSTGTDTALGSNSVNITQKSDGFLSGANRVGSVSQGRGSSSGNELNITQGGRINNIDRVSQVTTQGGNQTNRLSVTMTGTGNGSIVALSGAAGASGALASVLIQGDATKQARGSSATLDIGGVGNRFGVTQYGQGNTVGTLSLSGQFNQLGTYQDGTDNVITVAAVSGFNNNIGVRQIGTSNVARADVDGNLNGLSIKQNGVKNDADVSIIGNGNGWDNMFTGAAGMTGLQSGMIYQSGADNSASLAVLGDLNAFAYSQVGDKNAIEGSQIGNMNQLAVSQTGNSNTAHATQIGNNNNAAIIQ